jgi:hypothetical protein
VNDTITLLDTTRKSTPQIFTVPDKYLPKCEKAIANWKVAGIIYPSASHNPVNMFMKLKLNGEIRLLADLEHHNKIIVKAHKPITN